MKKWIFLNLLAFLFVRCGTKPDATTTKNNAPVIVKEVVGIAKIVPEREIIDLAAEVSGVVSSVKKKENDTVNAGDIILELRHSIEDAKVEQIKSQVSTQQAQINADESNIQESRVRYANASKELERLSRLFSKGAETRQAVDDANTAMLAYQANINRLLANVDVSKRKMAEVRAQLQSAVQEREQKIIRAPVKGILLELIPLPGNAVDSKQSIGQLSPEGRIIADGEIDELFADKIGNGQKAWIRNLGSNDTLSTGTVYFTASYLKKKSLFTDQAGEKEDRRVREIKILLDRPEKLLLNARVECVVDISKNRK